MEGRSAPVRNAGGTGFVRSFVQISADDPAVRRWPTLTSSFTPGPGINQATRPGVGHITEGETATAVLASKGNRPAKKVNAGEIASVLDGNTDTPNFHG